MDSRGSAMIETNLEDYLRNSDQKRTLQTENEKAFTNRFLRSNQRSRGPEVTVSNWQDDSKPQTPIK